MRLSKIEVSPAMEVTFKWEDNTETKTTTKKLREYCPCASCSADRENRSKSYIPIYHISQLKIQNIAVIGQYAIGITWQDGHNTGIYEFQLLNYLSKV